MLKTADYIYNNILIADGVNSTLEFSKKNQNGCDVSVRKIWKVCSAGIIGKGKTCVCKYIELPPTQYDDIEEYTGYSMGEDFNGWYLEPGGTYIVDLNEGMKFGPTDTGYIIQRSSLNRNGITAMSCVFDAGFNTINPDTGAITGAGMRIIVNNPYGVYLEENARIGQLIVFDSEDSNTMYNGQFQGGLKESNII